MNCRETRQLIDAYADGEMDLLRSVELERHLEDCGSCLESLRSTRAIKEAIRGASLQFDAPRGLDARMLAAVKKESGRQTNSNRLDWRRAWSPARWAVAAAVLLFAATGVFIGSRLADRTAGPNTLADELVSSHVRSLMAAHLFDVASTDQHTVKPWFAGKLDFSPVVIDLADRGYPLAGGRLDYIAGRPVAALVYYRRKHVVNLFEWPSSASGGDSPWEQRTGSARGYHMVEWSRGGMTFHALSDVNQADLQAFARELKRD